MIALGLLALTGLAGTALAGDDAPFALSVGSAKAKVGDTATISVSVTPNEGYHCNEQYPHKIKNITVDGGGEAPSKVKGSVSGHTIAFSIPVKLTEAGAHKVTGEARFSVCSDEQCVIKKVPISTTVTGE